VKVLLDACVLYPTVLREILIGLADAGLYTPLWSDRILEEWARAARKIGPTGEMQARAEVALLRAKWPGASVQPNEGDAARLWLPDPDDVHVLAAAIAGSADVLLTFNAKDFPRQSLSDEGILRDGPDTFVLSLWRDNPDAVVDVITRVQAEAARLSGEDMDLRKLLKRARMPRVGKALTA